MSKTALVNALRSLDLDAVRAILKRHPALGELELDGGLDLLQFCCSRSTAGDPGSAKRQLRLAQWLVGHGFDPRVLHEVPAGEDGEDDPASVSLAWFAVAKAQNTPLARYFLKRGAPPDALFAAAWWGNVEIVPDLIRAGEDVNRRVGRAGGTPLHMAIDVLQRGVEGTPELARRRLKLVETMLKLGADPNIAARDGTTPLHMVLKKDHGPASFALLLRYGADPDVPGKDGRTVREIASRKQDRGYARALENARR